MDTLLLTDALLLLSILAIAVLVWTYEYRLMKLEDQLETALHDLDQHASLDVAPPFNLVSGEILLPKQIDRYL